MVDPALTSDTLPVPSPDWAYFLDIDGTLVDLAESPDAVHTDAAIRTLIQRIARTASGALALISGRAITDIDRLFPDEQFAVAGQHGAERRTADGAHSFLAVIPSAQLEPARVTLRAMVARHPGLLLEDKGSSLALHYRGAPQLGGAVQLVFQSLQQRLGDGFAIQRGKCVVELQPAGSDKGAAILAFMQEPPFIDRRPVFIGDDASDEHGFAVVNTLGGYSVKVGRGQTVARWRLTDVAAVRHWLEQDHRNSRSAAVATSMEG